MREFDCEYSFGVCNCSDIAFINIDVLDVCIDVERLWDKKNLTINAEASYKRVPIDFAN